MPHIHEKIDFTASVFIVNGDTVLLRMHDKYKKWLSVGGHVELDEDPNQAALREAKEESGLEVILAGEITEAPSEDDGFFKNLIPPRFFNIHQIKTGSEHQHCDFIYFGTSSTREVCARPEEKQCEMRWFTRDELNDPSYDLYPTTRFYATTALDELGS